MDVCNLAHVGLLDFDLYLSKLHMTLRFMLHLSENFSWGGNVIQQKDFYVVHFYHFSPFLKNVPTLQNSSPALDYQMLATLLHYFKKNCRTLRLQDQTPGRGRLSLEAQKKIPKLYFSSRSYLRVITVTLSKYNSCIFLV